MGRQSAHTEYAIVDIETTGGYASGSGITEIAILIHDGQEIVERFESLINPQCPIPLSIQALTGITNEMVADSPTFDKLASRIYQLLDGRVFVAHNVNFDYSFLRHHLEIAGFHLSAPKLCTVRISRKIKPGFLSYSLGRLCDAMGIPINSRHRAGGDAQATAILFTQLMTLDVDGIIPEMLKKTSKHQQLPPNLPKEQFDSLPTAPGVYHFRDQGGQVIYVGKARNIRNRVAQHFSGHNPNRQRQHFLRHIHSVTYERCGTELLALLLEAIEIKRLWPVYNRALKRFEPKYALYTYQDQGGYLRLAVGKHAKHHQHIQLFHRQLDAFNLLHRLIRQFDLHPHRCIFGIQPSDSVPFKATSALPSDALLDVPQMEYNQRVLSAIEHLNQHLPTFAVFDKGREPDELSCIWVENGHLYGMGYVSRQADICDAVDMKACLTRYDSNHYMMQLIYSYAEKHPSHIWKPGQPTPNCT